MPTSPEQNSYSTFLPDTICSMPGGTRWSLARDGSIWYGLVTAAVAGCRVELMDVVDNRQLDALKSTFWETAQQMRVSTSRRLDLQRAAARIEGLEDFSAIYDALGCRYWCRPDGDISGIEGRPFDLVLSYHVLEHVPASAVGSLVAQTLAVLKPGGYAIHQIGLDDHLAHYDDSMHPKRYTEIGEFAWRLLFENRLQYINRLQKSDWLQLFADAGFTIVEVLTERTDISGLHPRGRFVEKSNDDLACTILTAVLQRPTPA